MEYFTLNTGKEVPPIGFGTWQLKPESVAQQAVLAALQVGYRVIDAARIYGNEAAVGQAVRESGIPREELFITTKLWSDDQGYDRTLRACRDSLDRLGLDYLDLYLIHWPATSKRHDSWRAFETLYEAGTIKAAGVSNYTVDHLEELASRSQLTPAVNQVEFHPFIYEQQQALLDYCADNGILIEAYSPLRRLSGQSQGRINEIARRYGISPQQVILKWCIQHGTLPLPRSQSPDHIKDNFNVFDFQIDDNDLRTLDSLSDGERVTWDPAGMG